jgi:DNA helicase-2/ATP-dependent DNA helicase PcrA
VFVKFPHAHFLLISELGEKKMVTKTTLTNEQKLAAKHNKGPAVIEACAGAGKTTTLATAVHYACTHGIPTEKIRMVAFNDVAAENMAKRLKQLFGITNVECTTIHSFGLSLVRSHFQLVGFTEMPEFLEKTTDRRLLEKAIRKVAESRGMAPSKLKHAVHQTFQQGKKSVSVKNDAKLAKQVDQVMQHYQAAKLDLNLLDYFDMVSLAVTLLKNNRELMNQVGASIDLLLVDEIQDLTMVEAQLVCYLAKSTKAALLVGDPKQTIYGFKGSSLKVWNKIHSYLEPVVYSLSESFRVPTVNLNFVNAVGQDICAGRPMISHQHGQKPCLFRANSPEEQYKWIAAKIKSLQVLGVPLEDIAIIARTRQSLVLLNNSGCLENLALNEAYRKAEPGQAQMLLRALVRLVKWHMKTKGATGFKAVNALTKLLIAIDLPKADIDRVVSEIEASGWEGMHIPKKPNEPCYRRVLQLKNAVEKASNLSPEAGMQVLIDALKPIAINKLGKKEKLAILCEFSEVKLDVRTCSHWNDVDTNSLPVASPQSAGLTLTTAHGAKGEEWPYVFVINVIEGEFPYRMSAKEGSLKEELRLFYVAITRASKKFFLIECPVYRNIFTKGSRKKRKGNFEHESSLTAAYASHLKLISK